MTVMINLFGGPGIGKSTLAPQVYAAIKRRHVSAELPREYAKDMIWEGRTELLGNQIAILGGQWDRLSQLQGKVDLVVNDSPVLLCSLYASPHYPQSFHDLVFWAHGAQQSVNFLMSRHDALYEAAGRVQDLYQAVALDAKLQALLVASKTPYDVLPPGDGALPALLAKLEERGLIPST